MISSHNNATAISAVTTVGSAARHVGLPAERHTTGAAVTAAHIALGDVDESGHALRIRSGPAGSRDYPGAYDFRGDGFFAAAFFATGFFAAAFFATAFSATRAGVFFAAFAARFASRISKIGRAHV